MFVGDSVLAQVAERFARMGENSHEVEPVHMLWSSQLAAWSERRFVLDIGGANVIVDFFAFRGLWTLRDATVADVEELIRLDEMDVTALIVNAGLHDVLYQSDAEVAHNARKVVPLLRQAFAGKLVWVLATATHFTRPGVRRYDTKPRIQAANAIISDLVRVNGGSVVDAFAISHGRPDSVVDGTHYAPVVYWGRNETPVLDTVVNEIVLQLCTEADAV